jgi:high affinity Mn2+ porin
VINAGAVLRPDQPPSDESGDKEKRGAAGGDNPAATPSDDKPGKKDATPPWYSVHEQATVVTQTYGPFRSPYVGPNSLLPRPAEQATTATATLFLAARVWEGGEIVFNPEMAGGVGVSGSTGIAGFPNGEATRVGQPAPTPYIARLLFRQTWGFDGPGEAVEDAPNQVAAARRDVNRFTLMVGKMSATDVFDANRYSHDPRTQFLNWTLMYNGAWDYPANVRGYTYGIAAEYNSVFWAARYGIFAEPAVANGAPIDPRFLIANGQIFELEQHWTGFDARPGKLREWVFLNRAHMGSYSEALALMPVNPDITLTREYRFKYGFGGNLEQEVARDVGVFVRAGWNDGRTESWAFTEVDRTAAAGVLVKGSYWRRPGDEAGLAGVVNGLSGPHRDYLAAGGVGFIIGDGRLRYAPEQIGELYYSWRLAPGIFVTFNVQGVVNPAYNADRGPVAIFGLRVHGEH